MIQTLIEAKRIIDCRNPVFALEMIQTDSDEAKRIIDDIRSQSSIRPGDDSDRRFKCYVFDPTNTSQSSIRPGDDSDVF